ncbi:hypothetical protein [Leisingera sp. ANG59]|nr:hypothetical protein [Leisingera sp. ANG59]NSY41322.1 hypothetical protein [Leisingera sp. ANG59]
MIWLQGLSDLVTILEFGIAAASTLLPSLEYAIMGMTGGMLLYVFL